MKDFIRHKLRLVLEGRLGTHSPSNPFGLDSKDSQLDDLSRTTKIIAYVNKNYGQDTYLQNTHEGDGIYLATIHTNGRVTIKTPNTKRKLADSDIGTIRTGRQGNPYVLIRANRGIEHPELDQPPQSGVRFKSPADDAAVKTYLIFGPQIIDWVRQHMEGESDYTTDDGDFKDNTNDEFKYKYDKYKKEKQQSRKDSIEMDPEEKSEFEKEQQRLADKYAQLRKRRGQ